MRSYGSGRRILFFILFLLSAAYLGGRTFRPESNGAGDNAAYGSQNTSSAGYARIVSLAPSITEILFMLGLGNRVVGVTRYCEFPPAAREKAQVGGYYDPNYEAVMALNPDLVIMLPEHDEPRRNLGRLGLNILVVDHRSITGILDSITAIGKACGKEQTAATAVNDIKVKMEHIRIRTRGLAQTRVMVCVGRNMGSGRIEDIYITGRNGFYNDLILLAGGVNAYNGDAAYPIVSEEGIIRINPQVIIDMVPDLGKKALDRSMVLKEWQALKGVAAVRNKRVHVFGQDYTVVPGPRFIHILEDMARVIHPEADWR
jgi:iron complex transport system substrate-binding protein